MAELSPSDPFVGSEIDGRFTVGERLGSGGMGAVYRARQHSVDREVAIKIISPEQAADPEAARRFLREAKLASSLSHPNTVAILDFGRTPGGVLFIVMELLRGKTLAQVLDADGNFSIARTAWIGVQLCDALEAAHRQSIVHRDLKPSNVLVLDDPPGRDLVKVLDFGLARSLAPGDANPSTITGTVLGTPKYMAPERLLGDPGDERADIFSLGVILYYALSGRHPYPAALVRLDQRPDALGGTVPPVLENVLARMACADPQGRYASAATAREALIAAIEQCAPSSANRLRAQPRQAEGVSQNLTRNVPPPGTRRLRPSLVAGAIAAAAIAIAIALAAGSGILPGFSPDPVPTETPLDGAAARPTAEQGGGTVATAPSPEPSPSTTAVAAEVELEIVARPPARVTLDGVDAGISPVVRRYARGDRSIAVTLRLEGYRPEKRTLVTDQSRSLSIDLTALPAESPTATPATSPTPTPTESFIIPAPVAPTPTP